MMEYSLSYDAYIEYISVTKNNENTSLKLAERKLNRNIILGELIHDDAYALKYQYGTLVVEVLFGEITSVYKVKKWNGVRKKKRYELMSMS